MASRQSPFLTFTESAKRLKLPRRQVFDLARRGMLSIVYVDGKRRIAAESVTAYAQNLADPRCGKYAHFDTDHGECHFVDPRWNPSGKLCTWPRVKPEDRCLTFGFTPKAKGAKGGEA